MKKETTYTPDDIERGRCKCCGETSSQIVRGENMCVDCIQEIEFIEECARVMNESQSDE